MAQQYPPKPPDPKPSAQTSPNTSKTNPPIKQVITDFASI